jgi:hypothetical protein
MDRSVNAKFQLGSLAFDYPKPAPLSVARLFLQVPPRLPIDRSQSSRQPLGQHWET